MKMRYSVNSLFCSKSPTYVKIAGQVKQNFSPI